MAAHAYSSIAGDHLITPQPLPCSSTTQILVLSTMSRESQFFRLYQHIMTQPLLQSSQLNLEAEERSRCVLKLIKICSSQSGYKNLVRSLDYTTENVGYLHWQRRIEINFRRYYYVWKFLEKMHVFSFIRNFLLEMIKEVILLTIVSRVLKIGTVIYSSKQPKRQILTGVFWFPDPSS